jgi:hypothetical protein
MGPFALVRYVTVPLGLVRADTEALASTVKQRAVCATALARRVARATGGSTPAVARTHSARNVRVRVSRWGISSWAQLPRADGNGVRRGNKVRR